MSLLRSKSGKKKYSLDEAIHFVTNDGSEELSKTFFFRIIVTKCDQDLEVCLNGRGVVTWQIRIP